MNQLSNVFSLLNLDVADNQDETQAEINSGDTDGVTGEGKEKGTDDSPGEMKVLEHETGDLKLESVAGECKLPLVWIDLEMTGLNIEVDRILEIACIVTNGNLTKSIEGPDLVIHQAKECVDSMGAWCQEHHAASGLTEKVLKSAFTEEEAEKQYLPTQVLREFGCEFEIIVEDRRTEDKLASRYLFTLQEKYMPNLASLFSHVLVDVSSVKALCLRWYPRVDRKKAPKKENKHRAMDDIKESIAELKYYKEHIFKASKHLSPISSEQNFPFLGNQLSQLISSVAWAKVDVCVKGNNRIILLAFPIIDEVGLDHNFRYANDNEFFGLGWLACKRNMQVD